MLRRTAPLGAGGRLANQEARIPGHQLRVPTGSGVKHDQDHHLRTRRTPVSIQIIITISYYFEARARYHPLHCAIFDLFDTFHVQMLIGESSGILFDLTGSDLYQIISFEGR
jgi:hypothetical protein